MRTALFIAGGCVGMLAGALLLSHVISTPDPVVLEDLTPPAPVAVPEPVVAPRPMVVERAAPPPPPPAQEMQRPEFDAADAVLANANASASSVRDAYGLFQRCVQYEPSNARCTASLQRAQARVAALPPELPPPTPALVAQEQKMRMDSEIVQKRELAKMRTLPALKGGQLMDRFKMKKEAQPQ